MEGHLGCFKILASMNKAAINIHVQGFFLRFDLFISREEKEGRKRGPKRNINVWLPVPLLGTWPGPQPRHVPWLGIKLVTLWFEGRHSVHCATSARAPLLLIWAIYYCILIIINIVILFVIITDTELNCIVILVHGPCYTNSLEFVLYIYFKYLKKCLGEKKWVI